MAMSGSELKAIRKKVGLSQAEFGIAIGMTRETVGAMERDQAPIVPRTELAVRALVEGPAPSTIPVFKPAKRRSSKHHIRLDLTALEYAQVQACADRAGLSLKEFCKQGVFFAMQHLDKSGEQ